MPYVPEGWDLGRWDEAHWDAVPGITMTADAAAFAWTGVPVTFHITRAIVAAPAAFTLTGYSVRLIHLCRMALDTGQFSWVGVPVRFYAGRKVLAQPGTFTWAGIAADGVHGAGAGNHVMTAGIGSFKLIGQSILMERGSPTIGPAGTLDFGIPSVHIPNRW